MFWVWFFFQFLILGYSPICVVMASKEGDFQFLILGYMVWQLCG